MAKPSLFTHRKFAHLSVLLGSKALAVGSLEMIWHFCYSAGDAFLGESAAVELMADWHGEPGFLTQSLLKAGFLDLVEGGYDVHDLEGNEPSYVKDRRRKQEQRNRERDLSRDNHGKVTGQSQVSHVIVRSLPDPLPSPTKSTHSAREAEANNEFDRLFLAWPWKTHVPEAQHAYASVLAELPPIAELIRIVKAWAQTDSWQEKDGRYAGRLDKWLYRRGWKEPIPGAKVKPVNSDPGYDRQKVAEELSAANPELRPYLLDEKGNVK
jgi:hypothetical protein